MQFLVRSNTLFDMNVRANTTCIPEPVTPTALDVLCGTGVERINQPGNELFDAVVMKYVEKYLRAESKREKMAISKGALDELASSGVRFLKKHPVHQCWYEADAKVGRDRIGHFLRHHIPKSAKDDQRCHNIRRAPRPSPCVRPLSVFSNSLRATFDIVGKEAIDEIRSVRRTAPMDQTQTLDYPATPWTTSSYKPPTFNDRNINIVSASLSSFCSKEKGLSGLFPPNQGSAGFPCSSATLMGYLDKNFDGNTSLLDRDQWDFSNDPRFSASSFESVPSEKHVGTDAVRHSLPPSGQPCLIVDDRDHPDSDLENDLVDLFDDADLAECLDWQLQ
ncbi:hypothetical protein MHU86_9543 [Fragilaria crotonensis]|nr:hypothetical protein MHU86_9543 [Fragilaria crotonensis]